MKVSEKDKLGISCVTFHNVSMPVWCNDVPVWCNDVALELIHFQIPPLCHFDRSHNSPSLFQRLIWRQLTKFQKVYYYYRDLVFLHQPLKV